MAGRKTKEESLKAKIEANLASQAKLVEKLEGLKAVEAGLKSELADIHKAEKELMKAINKSGMSLDDVKAKLGI